MIRFTAFAAAFGAMTTLPAGAAGLKDSARINEGLIAIGMADEIRKNCPSISARMVRAASFLKSLERHARSQGFTEAEIDVFVDDKQHKAVLEGKARARLAERGATGDPEGYCRVGQEEIAAGTQVGAMLRGK
ncbi:DUF5333 domain-containing protein [Alphaproteobacteria bacterium KMM 3653]|uniref:DUF5333 domain-containing protein n=1 Tax=Harenicola maris TaxID=2841044 RepID=A0AAP2CMN9_9RHOB|nr:DUF5333 domain-containing protein [Harenicola maris]